MSTKHDDILNATSDLIFEHGLHAVSMAQIAKAAGVGMGTIYNYFPTKEDLVNALFDRLAQALSQAMLEHYDATAPHQERLIQLCRNLLRYGARHQRELLLFEQLNHSPSISPAVQERDYGMKTAVFTLLHEAQAAGHIKDLPPVLLANLSVSYAATVVRSKVRNCITLDDDLLERATEAWYDLIRVH